MTSFLFLIHLKLLFFNDKSYDTQSKQSAKINTTSDDHDLDEQDYQNNIKFYTQLCLLVTLTIYVLTKLFKNEDISYNNSKTYATQTSDTNQVSKSTTSVAVQTDEVPFVPSVVVTVAATNATEKISSEISPLIPKRSTETCMQLFREKQKLDELSEEEVLDLVSRKVIPLYKLESFFTNPVRAVAVRRKQIESKINRSSCLADVPFENYNYGKVTGSCCENVIGYMPIPLGVAGPLLIDGKLYHIPMATTEGTLIASTNRGCSALSV